MKMKEIGIIVRKSLLLLATVIIVAHSLIPHQHKSRINFLVHEGDCFICSSLIQKESTSILQKFEDVIKHIDLGEKHLEDFIVSNYKINLLSVLYFEISSSPTLTYHSIEINLKKDFNYCKIEIPSENFIFNNGLRAPPYLIYA